ncbi:MULTISPECIES: hypothetical protein [Cupriavidus]
MTLPASPPISMVDLANETRNTIGGLGIAHDDVKRLLGLPRSHPGPISLMDCLGKTRPWWGLVPVTKSTGGSQVIVTYYTWIQSHGGLAAAVDPYFGNVPIITIQSLLSDAESQSILSFASDPGFRNNIKGQLLDNNFVVTREVIYTPDPGGLNWRVRVASLDPGVCLFVSEGVQFVNFMKL